MLREERPPLILVDSSGWIEYLADRPRARRFARYLEGSEPLLVSAIEIYEVYKVIRRDLSEERAVEAVSALRRATIAPVDGPFGLMRGGGLDPLRLHPSPSVAVATGGGAGRPQMECTLGTVGVEGPET